MFFVSWRHCLIFFVNGHGNQWGSNLAPEKIRRNIASFHNLCPDFFPLKSCIFANLSLYFQTEFCEKRALLCFSF